MTDVELDARVTALEENSDVGTPNGKLNKIAFQWDAYRLHVNRIFQNALCKGGGISAPGKGVWSGGVCSGGAWSGGAWFWGLFGLGDVCSGGGRVSYGGCLVPGWCVSQHALRQTPPVNIILDTCY